jgi:hypothetical protein
VPYVSIRQHASAYVSIRQHTSAYVSIRHTWRRWRRVPIIAYVSIRQHTSAYFSIRHTWRRWRRVPIIAYVSIRQHTSAYVSIRHTWRRWRRVPIIVTALTVSRCFSPNTDAQSLFACCNSYVSVFVLFGTSKESKLRAPGRAAGPAGTFAQPAPVSSSKEACYK